MRGNPTTAVAAAACIVLAAAGPAAAAANTGTDPGGAPAPVPNSVTWSETSDGTETIVNHRADPAAPLFASAFLSAGTATTVATGVPDATVMLNVTAVAATGSGHTRVWPCNESRPNSSVNNYTAGQTIPNFTAVHTDAAGYACVYTAGPADLLVDQYGVANGVAATSPERVLDTRTAAAVPAGGVVKIASSSAYSQLPAKGRLLATNANDTVSSPAEAIITGSRAASFVESPSATGCAVIAARVRTSAKPLA